VTSCVLGTNVYPDERPFVRPLVSPDDCRSLRLRKVDSSGGCNPNEKRTKTIVRSRAPDFRRCTALPSPRQRLAHSIARAAESRHSRLPASVTASRRHTTFHASRLAPIRALFCAFKHLINKSTVWSISEQVPPITLSIPYSTLSNAACILVSCSSEEQTPRFMPSKPGKNPSFTCLDPHKRPAYGHAANAEIRWRVALLTM